MSEPIELPEPVGSVMTHTIPAQVFMPDFTRTVNVPAREEQRATWFGESPTNGTHLFTADQIRAAVLADRERRWLSIDDAPRVKTPMIVVRGVLASGYVTDPWCVWWDEGEWQRWPHREPPTHFMPLPPAPKEPSND